MINALSYWKDFAQWKAVLEGFRWHVRERTFADKEIPNALLVVLHPYLPLKIAIYTLEDIQLLVQNVAKYFYFQSIN